MNIFQTLLESLESLTSNKLRSGLTILGIVIGVASVIAMLAIGQGAQGSILGQIQGMGTNLLYVSAGNNTTNPLNVQPLTLADATALENKSMAPDIAQVSPLVTTRLTVSYQNNSQTEITINGVTPAYATMQSQVVTDGQNITDQTVNARSSVAVIGPELATLLFGSTNGAVGQSIRIDGQPFRVIGVLAAKGGSSFNNPDTMVMVPITTALARLRTRNAGSVDQIIVQATSADTVTTAIDQTTSILSGRHHVIGTKIDFTVRNQQDILQTAQSITGVLTLFLGGIAGISLLVGGIGIMNIMLVSVTERTREIGLRKALGARRSDILIQFLTESALLSLTGGIVGILLGWLIATIIGNVASSSGTALTPVVGADAVILATAFSTAVGLFFGFYPANRAARLAPVEALRYE